MFHVMIMTDVNIFGTTINAHEIFSTTVDIQAIVSGHVESIVLLSKLHTKQNIEVELEMRELDLTAAESKATYEELRIMF